MVEMSSGLPPRAVHRRCEQDGGHHTEGDHHAVGRRVSGPSSMTLSDGLGIEASMRRQPYAPPTDSNGAPDWTRPRVRSKQTTASGAEIAGAGGDGRQQTGNASEAVGGEEAGHDGAVLGFLGAE